MALPDLTPEQRAQALEKATQARRRRAEVKNALKARSMNLSEVLELADSDEAVAKMKVVSLLESLPRVGTNTATVLMDEYKIAQSRRVRGLGPVQRKALVERVHMAQLSHDTGSIDSSCWPDRRWKGNRCRRSLEALSAPEGVGFGDDSQSSAW